MEALGYKDTVGSHTLDDLSEFEIVDELSAKTGLPIPKAVEDIRFAVYLHDDECDVDKMEETVSGLLK